MARRVRFTDLLEIYRKVDFAGPHIGSLTIDDSALLQVLILASSEDNADDSGISIRSGDPSCFKIGQTIQIETAPPRTGLGILSVTFDDYLNSSEAKLAEKASYYICDSKFYSKDPDIPSEILEYRYMLKFISLLEASAHYLDHKKEEAIYFSSGRYSIPIKYFKEDLGKLDKSVVDDLLSFCNAEPHVSQKKAILTETIIKLTSDIMPERKFRHLVDNSTALLENLVAGYSMFASNFTYEKIRDELESLKIDMTIKIHKAISDIQGQILGIPVATVLAISQMKETKNLDAQFIYNSALMLGILFFTALIIGFLFNQKLTLETIEEEILRLKDKYHEKMKDARPIYKNIFKNLCSRLTIQYLALYLVLALLLVAFSSSLVFYFVFTDQARDIF